MYLLFLFFIATPTDFKKILESTHFVSPMDGNNANNASYNANNANNANYNVNSGSDSGSSSILNSNSDSDPGPNFNCNSNPVSRESLGYAYQVL